jgi:hypothetical protein
MGYVPRAMSLGLCPWGYVPASTTFPLSREPSLVHACSPLCNLPCNFKQRKPFQPHDFKGLLPRLKRARYPLCGQFASSSLCVYSPSWSSFCCADPSLKRDLLVFVGIQRSHSRHSAVPLPPFSRPLLALSGANSCRLSGVIPGIQRCIPGDSAVRAGIQVPAFLHSAVSAFPAFRSAHCSTQRSAHCWRFSDASHT